jgi:hypothetical protein
MSRCATAWHDDRARSGCVEESKNIESERTI